jgi:uncharacterized protein
MSRAPEPVAVAILAKAPLPGLAKTRLIPVLGAHAAAVLQERLTERAVETACAAAIGSVALWGTLDVKHRMFSDLAARFPVTLARQPEGDLGARMLAAFEAASGPALVIGTDCPVLTADHLRQAADILRHECDAVVIPAEDGGYVLIGMRVPQIVLFDDMAWSTDTVMTMTRERLRDAGLTWKELPPLWDIDREADIDRAEHEGFNLLG